jgi:hypothetical protein
MLLLLPDGGGDDGRRVEDKGRKEGRRKEGRKDRYKGDPGKRVCEERNSGAASIRPAVYVCVCVCTCRYTRTPPLFTPIHPSIPTPSSLPISSSSHRRRRRHLLPAPTPPNSRSLSLRPSSSDTRNSAGKEEGGEEKREGGGGSVRQLLPVAAWAGVIFSIAGADRDPNPASSLRSSADSERSRTITRHQHRPGRGACGGIFQPVYLTQSNRDFSYFSLTNKFISICGGIPLPPPILRFSVSWREKNNFFWGLNLTCVNAILFFFFETCSCP